MKTLEKLLLREVQNPIVRSALVNFGLAVSVAAVEALQAQATDSHYNYSLVAGAIVLASAKWFHSTMSDIAAEAELKKVVAQLSATGSATYKGVPLTTLQSPPQSEIPDHLPPDMF